MSVPFPWFGFVFAVSQQGVITTDKIQKVKRESFEKSETEGSMAFADHSH